jgi:hypothetical protein
MPGSQWSSRGSSRAGSAPGSGEVTRVSSASSAVQVSSTEVSRASSSSFLGRILRSRSGSSTGSIPFPRYLPIDGGGARHTPNGYRARIVLLRLRLTPLRYHILNCYDPRAPAFSPVQGTCSAAVSRTASAESLLELHRTPSRLSIIIIATSIVVVFKPKHTFSPLLRIDKIMDSTSISKKYHFF